MDVRTSFIFEAITSVNWMGKPHSPNVTQLHSHFKLLMLLNLYCCAAYYINYGLPIHLNLQRRRSLSDSTCNEKREKSERKGRNMKDANMIVTNRFIAKLLSSVVAFTDLSFHHTIVSNAGSQ